MSCGSSAGRSSRPTERCWPSPFRSPAASGAGRTRRARCSPSRSDSRSPRRAAQPGLERSRGDALRGLQTGLSSIFGQLSSHRVGDDVHTTLDPKAQRVALQQLAGRAGLGGRPRPADRGDQGDGVDPRLRRQPPGATGPNITQLQPRHPVQLSAPGSTFKVVTATAAIDSGKYTPSSVVDGKSPVTISGVPLNNDNNQAFGPVDLTTALTFSVNTVWAQVAEHLGRADDDRIHEALRLLFQAPGRPAPERADLQPPVLVQGSCAARPAARTRTSAGSPSGRAACWSRRCRWRWWRRRWPTAGS